MRPARLAAAGLLLAGPLAAQARVAGGVRLARAADTVPVAGARVVLHRVGIATQGPIDSAATDPRGRFAFRFAIDTTANYLLSTRHAGIEYFSSPLPVRQTAAPAPVELIVFDTSSAAPTATRSRTLVVSAPDASGARTVVDWFGVANDGVVTRVGRDSLDPTWSGRLPRGVEQAELGDARFSQFSPDAVAFRNDSVFVFAPLAPGQKELLIQYQLPAGATTLDLALAPADSIEIFVEEAGARVRSAGWAPADTQSFQGRSFHRWRRTGPAERLSIRFPGVGVAPGLALALLVGALGLALAVAAVAALRRRKPAARAPAPAAPGRALAEELADRIARLDAERGAPGALDEAAYRAERERLMAELRAALAARQTRS